MRLFMHSAACVIACILPGIFPSGSGTGQVRSHYSPITSFNGAALRPATMSSKEQEFYHDFPGDVLFFRLENRPNETLFLRYTESPTRKLHPAETCLQAQGLQVSQRTDTDVTIPELSSRPLSWSRCVTQKNGHPVEVLQTVISFTNESNYTSIPTWYWLTTFSSDDPGPWLAVEWCRPEQATVLSENK